MLCAEAKRPAVAPSGAGERSTLAAANTATIAASAAGDRERAQGRPRRGLAEPPGHDGRDGGA